MPNPSGRAHKPHRVNKALHHLRRAVVVAVVEVLPIKQTHHSAHRTVPLTTWRRIRCLLKILSIWNLRDYWYVLVDVFTVIIIIILLGVCVQIFFSGFFLLCCQCSWVAQIHMCMILLTLENLWIRFCTVDPLPLRTWCIRIIKKWQMKRADNTWWTSRWTKSGNSY